MSGTLLVLLGVWGALIPFVGPYFDYAYTPDNAWDYTTGRLLLQVLPGVGAVLGGLLVLGSANRAAAMFGCWLAALSGAWFVLGVPLSAIWGSPTVGEPIGSTTRQFVEYVGFFGGLGVAIVFLAAFALGRFAVVGVREAERAAQAVTPEVTQEERVTTAPAAAPEREGETGSHRFSWRRSRHASTR
ncbi:hypothetical protein AB0E63_46405 [Kribbella sp. NPDC026596]|uniref:hypothetical protein n=1 Tax=Kribbella sp. NPDC026596 TaxID=3155122 RepID=UPI00340B13BE